MATLDEALAWVHARLRDPSTNLSTVAGRTGLNVWWLFKLRAGRYTDPGFIKIGKLILYFGGRSPTIPKEKACK